jgi:ribosome-associated translation inhibitor RaiA
MNIHADGFDLSPRLRALVEARLFAALGRLRDQIESVRVHLRTRIGRNEPDTISCEVAARLRPAGEVRVRTDNPQMQVSIDRAAQAIRAAFEREVVQRPSPAESPSVTGVTADPAPDGALEIVLDRNRISQHQRGMLERPENYTRPLRVREYRRPPGVEDDASPEELTQALVSR